MPHLEVVALDESRYRVSLPGSGELEVEASPAQVAEMGGGAAPQDVIAAWIESLQSEAPDELSGHLHLGETAQRHPHLVDRVRERLQGTVG